MACIQYPLQVAANNILKCQVGYNLLPQAPNADS
jgi:hypothetical protein